MGTYRYAQTPLINTHADISSKVIGQNVGLSLFINIHTLCMRAKLCMIKQLERTLGTASQNKDQTQNPSQTMGATTNNEPKQQNHLLTITVNLEILARVFIFTNLHICNFFVKIKTLAKWPDHSDIY